MITSKNLSQLVGKLDIYPTQQHGGGSDPTDEIIAPLQCLPEETLKKNAQGPLP